MIIYKKDTWEVIWYEEWFIENETYWVTNNLPELFFIKAFFNKEDNSFYEWANEEEINNYHKSIIPQEITPRQIRLALIQSWINLWAIDSMIDNLEEPQKSIVKTLREYSLTYNREDEMLIQFANQLWLTNEQLDELFILWGSL